MTALLLTVLLSQGAFDVTPGYVAAIDWHQSSDAAMLATAKGRAIANASSWTIASAEGGAYAVHAWRNRERICAATKTALTAASVQGLKRLIKRERPDHSDHLAFPSGHTAYSALTMPEGSLWYLALPVSVATGRMLAGKHDWLDVLGGAGIGFGFRALPCGR